MHKDRALVAAGIICELWPEQKELSPLALKRFGKGLEQFEAEEVKRAIDHFQNTREWRPKVCHFVELIGEMRDTASGEIAGEALGVARATYIHPVGPLRTAARAALSDRCRVAVKFAGGWTAIAGWKKEFEAKNMTIWQKAWADAGAYIRSAEVIPGRQLALAEDQKRRGLALLPSMVGEAAEGFADAVETDEPEPPQVFAEGDGSLPWLS